MEFFIKKDGNVNVTKMPPNNIIKKVNISRIESESHAPWYSLDIIYIGNNDNDGYTFSHERLSLKGLVIIKNAIDKFLEVK